MIYKTGERPHLALEDCLLTPELMIGMTVMRLVLGKWVNVISRGVPDQQGGSIW